MAQQALVVLEAWQDVDGVPETGPAFEAAQAHVGGDQAGGGADGHTVAPVASFHAEPFHQIGLPMVVSKYWEK